MKNTSRTAKRTGKHGPITRRDHKKQKGINTKKATTNLIRKMFRDGTKTERISRLGEKINTTNI